MFWGLKYVRKLYIIFRQVRQFTNSANITQGKFEEAGPLYRKSVTIQENALGLEHPDVATTLNNLATLLTHVVSVVSGF